MKASIRARLVIEYTTKKYLSASTGHTEPTMLALVEMINNKDCELEAIVDYWEGKEIVIIIKEKDA